jgi:ABC-type cobalt transport system substrate-binding protein
MVMVIMVVMVIVMVIVTVMVMPEAVFAIADGVVEVTVMQQGRGTVAPARVL